MLKSLFRKSSIVSELFSFLWKEKMWWLIPIVVLLVLLGLLIVFAHSSPIAPFIYTLF